jgi:hypothetical protein
VYIVYLLLPVWQEKSNLFKWWLYVVAISEIDSVARLQEKQEKGKVKSCAAVFFMIFGAASIQSALGEKAITA